MKILRRILSPFILVLTLFIIFEEWLWIRLTGLTQWIAKLWIFRELESILRKLPAWAALIVLFTPSLIIIPFKLVALYLVVHQHFYLGIFSILLAKIMGTAIAARIFAITKDKVLRIQWFFYVYTKINHVVSWSWNWLQAQAIFQQTKVIVTELKIKIKKFIEG